MLSKGVHQLPRANKPFPNKEALKLYRKALKFSNELTWTDDRGASWRERVRTSARHEFEVARDEPDPFIVGQMIVTGHEAIKRLREKLIKKYAEMNQKLAEGNGIGLPNDPQNIKGLAQGIDAQRDEESRRREKFSFESEPV